MPTRVSYAAGQWEDTLARLHGAIAQGVLGDHPAASLEKLPHFIAPCSNPLFKAKGGFKPFGF